MSGGIVPASAHGHFQLVRACEVERGRDIAGADATGDHRRPAVDESIEAAAYRVVFSVGWADDGTGQRPPELVQALINVSHQDLLVTGHVLVGLGGRGPPDPFLTFVRRRLRSGAKEHGAEHGRHGRKAGADEERGVVAAVERNERPVA